MYSNQDGKSGLAVGSLVIGAVAGAIAGILFAPKSGRETRDELKETLTQVKDDVATKIGDFDIQELTKNAYQTVVDTVVRTYEDAKKLTASEASNIKSDLEQGYEDIIVAGNKASKKGNPDVTQ